jgi:glycosyltransferase 2 family protein
MKKHYLKIIGFLILAYIFYKIDFSGVVEILTGARIVYIIAAISLALPTILIKSWRWKYLLKMQGVNYSLKNAFTSYLSSGFLGTITPGKVGEFSKVFFLREDEGVNIGKAFSSVLTDRFIDLIVLLTFSFVGVFYFSLALDKIVLASFFLILFSLAIAIVFTSKRLRNKLFHLINSWLPFKKYVKQPEIHFNNFFDALNDFKSIKILIPITVSFAANLIFYFSVYLIALSLRIQISYFNVMLCISIVSVISLIPVSISGIGTRDVTLVVLFPIIGLSKESAIGFSLVFLLVLHVCNAIFGGIAWWRKPLKMEVISGFNMKLTDSEKT